MNEDIEKLEIHLIELTELQTQHVESLCACKLDGNVDLIGFAETAVNNGESAIKLLKETISFLKV